MGDPGEKSSQSVHRQHDQTVAFVSMATLVFDQGS